MHYSLDPAATPYAEEVVKKSRFIARLRRVDSQDTFEEFLASARAADPGAGHHCFAYVIGDDAESRLERYSDDGEPGGTAGVPILTALKARGLVNVAAVVSRYFGGIKLGTGGLARAYSGSVNSALEGVVLVARTRSQVFHLPVDHETAGRVEAELRRRGFDVTGVEYGRQAVLTVMCPDAAELEAAVGAVMSGSGHITCVGQTWR